MKKLISSFCDKKLKYGMMAVIVVTVLISPTLMNFSLLFESSRYVGNAIVGTGTYNEQLVKEKEININMLFSQLLGRVSSSSNEVHIATAACGKEKYIDDSKRLITSMALFGQMDNNENEYLNTTIHVISHHFNLFDNYFIENIYKIAPWLTISFINLTQIESIFKSLGNDPFENEIKKGFAKLENAWGKCSPLRLFYPYIFSNIDTLFHLDTDIVSFMPIAKMDHVLKSLLKFEKLMAASYQVHVDEKMDALILKDRMQGTFYVRKNYTNNTYYGLVGINAGVLAINLKFARKIDFTHQIIEIYKQETYWELVDQDLVNYYFGHNENEMLLLHCMYNIRTDSKCIDLSRENYPNNKHIIDNAIFHGNRHIYHEKKYGQMIYSIIDNQNISKIGNTGNLNIKYRQMLKQKLVNLTMLLYK